MALASQAKAGDGGSKIQKQEVGPPPFQSWDVFWADYKAGLVVNRGLASVDIPGEVNVVVTVPNDLAVSVPVATLEAGSTPVRELNVVVRPENRMQSVTLSGSTTNTIIGQVVSARDPRNIRPLRDPKTLKAGAVVVEEGVRPQHVNIISQVKNLRDERRRH
jgi:hypothetical protein